MGYMLESGEVFGAGLHRICFEELDSVSRELARIGDLQPDAIHECRRHLKKSRSLLQIARFALPDKKAARVAASCLGQAGRLFASRRDREAVGECLDRALQAVEEPGARLVCERIRAHLESAPGRGDAAPVDLEESIREAWRLLDSVRATVRDWSAWEVGAVPLCHGIRRSYRAARDSMKRGRDKKDPEILHQWRKHAKHLRHHMMIVSAAWPAFFGMMEVELHALTDMLGEIHDRALLMLYLERQGSEFLAPCEQETALVTLQGLTDREVSLALRAGERLFSEKPALFGRRISGYIESWVTGGAGDFKA